MNWKKAVSVMLVGIMALSMTACGDSGETSTDAASGGGSTAESTEGAGTSASGDDKLVVLVSALKSRPELQLTRLSFSLQTIRPRCRQRFWAARANRILS